LTIQINLTNLTFLECVRETVLLNYSWWRHSALINR